VDGFPVWAIVVSTPDTEQGTFLVRHVFKFSFTHLEPGAARTRRRENRPLSHAHHRSASHRGFHLSPLHQGPCQSSPPAPLTLPPCRNCGGHHSRSAEAQWLRCGAVREAAVGVVQHRSLASPPLVPSGRLLLPTANAQWLEGGKGVGLGLSRGVLRILPEAACTCAYPHYPHLPKTTAGQRRRDVRQAPRHPEVPPATPQLPCPRPRHVPLQSQAPISTSRAGPTRPASPRRRPPAPLRWRAPGGREGGATVMEPPCGDARCD
jgi:hypothetical protein